MLRVVIGTRPAARPERTAIQRARQCALSVIVVVRFGGLSGRAG